MVPAKVWDLATGKVLATLTTGPDTTARWRSPHDTGGFLATANEKGVLKLWRPRPGRRGWPCPRSRRGGVAFSPDGKLMGLRAFGTPVNPEGTITLWEAGASTVRSVLSEGHGMLWSFAFSTDSKTLAAPEA